MRRLQVDVQEVAAHVAVERSVYAPHIMNNVPYSMLLEVEDPRRGRVQDVALEHLDGDHNISATISQAKALPDQC